MSRKAPRLARSDFVAELNDKFVANEHDGGDITLPVAESPWRRYHERLGSTQRPGRVKSVVWCEGPQTCPMVVQYMRAE